MSTLTCPRSNGASRPKTNRSGNFHPKSALDHGGSLDRFSKPFPRQRAGLAGFLPVFFAGSLTKPFIGARLGSFDGAHCLERQGQWGKAERQLRRRKLTSCAFTWGTQESVLIEA